MKDEAPRLEVFISHRASVCGECHEELGRQAWVFLAGDRGALCLSCADLDHLVFLPSGDTAVTRRARKLSTLSAVVLRWSRARQRYERQGLLVEEDALHEAEAACLADEEARARRRERGRSAARSSTRSLSSGSRPVSASSSRACPRGGRPRSRSTPARSTPAGWAGPRPRDVWTTRR